MPVVARRAASAFGDADFVVLPDRRISFRQAEAASRRLAKELLAAGAGKGTRVGIHLPTGPEWAVAWMAVSRIGALALPFSTIYRPAELRTAIRIGDVALLLAPAILLGKDHAAYLEEAVPGLPGSTRGRLRVPELPHLRSIRLLGGSTRPWADRFDVSDAGAGDPVDGFDDELLAALEAEVTPADPMLVVFTSGTTAEPKAVIHSQGAVLRKTAPVADAGLDATFPGRVLSLMPFFWVGGLQNAAGALQSGGAILTLERLDPLAALELAKRERATSINGNPTALRALLGAAGETLPSLRPLPIRPWEGGPSSRGDDPTGLGMTETLGVWAAIEGFDCRVVDPETGEVVDEGEVGEFLVRGYGLMQGLYKGERENVFTPDGFYRTGDLGYVEKGKVYFQGRLDDMIKTRGANVAPAEVEAVLNAFPQVRLSFVVGIPHDEYGQEVAAAVVAEAGRQIDVESLTAQARELLSPYKVPTLMEVVRHEEIPWLPSSKADRRGVAALLLLRRSARHAGRPGPSRSR
jgi:acyl-CoA synthetase (AMP-forming)/AMP-acid ligase II